MFVVKSGTKQVYSFNRVCQNCVSSVCKFCHICVRTKPTIPNSLKGWNFRQLFQPHGLTDSVTSEGWRFKSCLLCLLNNFLIHTLKNFLETLISFLCFWKAVQKKLLRTLVQQFKSYFFHLWTGFDCSTSRQEITTSTSSKIVLAADWIMKTVLNRFISFRDDFINFWINNFRLVWKLMYWNNENTGLLNW